MFFSLLPCTEMSPGLLGQSCNPQSLVCLSTVNLDPKLYPLVLNVHGFLTEIILQGGKKLGTFRTDAWGRSEEDTISCRIWGISF